MLKTRTVNHLHAPAIPEHGSSLPSDRPWLTRELNKVGYTGRSIAQLVRSRRLIRICKGIYVDAGAWRGLSSTDRHVQLALAHEMASNASGRNVYSHTTAAVLHGLSLLDIPQKVHVTRQCHYSTTKTATAVHRHVTDLPKQEITFRRSLFLTTLERTVIDCASILRHRNAVVIADHAVRLGASLERMQHISDGMSGSRGIRQVRCVIADVDARAESPGETLTRLLVQDLNVPMPALQVPVRSRGGSYRLDFAWPDLKVALEFDGDSKYFAYRPTPQVLLRERKRERELMEDGWVFVRLEWKDLFWPEQVEARIRAAFARASRLNA